MTSTVQTEGTVRRSRVREHAETAFATQTVASDRAPNLALDQAAVAYLIDAVRNGKPVSGLTHAHYRYPARFSPILARACIEIFSSPGDLICDPFMGGGTSAVEAAAAGRDFIGCDISTLAAFLSETKARAYDEAELKQLAEWSTRASAAINMYAASPPANPLVEAGYLKNMSGQGLWRLRKALEQVVATIDDLPEGVAALARCATLRAAQGAIDSKRQYPNIKSFRKIMLDSAKVIERGTRDYMAALQTATVSLGRPPRINCINRSVVGFENDERLAGAVPPKLIVTSPPYPGVHVLYHRWQVDGRKESPLPFWIANRLDGSGESYYTLGHRKNPELKTYFDTLHAGLESMASISDEHTILVQVVAFAEPAWQLPRYLEANAAAGWSERVLAGLDSPDGRLWRHVPNRRWYADLKGATTGAFEVVLFHRRSA